MSSVEERYERIDATLERVNAMFGNDPRSRDYGYDCRNLLDLADYHAKRLSWPYADSILSILDELLGRMETVAREQAEMDAWCDAEMAKEAAS